MLGIYVSAAAATRCNKSGFDFMLTTPLARFVVLLLF